VDSEGRPLVWLKSEIKTPPLSREARIEAGTLLRRIQKGELIGLPHSRPMPTIGKRCHELRINDEGLTWRIIYRIDPDAIIISDVFAKKTQTTPKKAIKLSQERFKKYDEISK